MRSLKTIGRGREIRFWIDIRIAYYLTFAAFVGGIVTGIFTVHVMEVI